jgi:hypothetical protein
MNRTFMKVAEIQVSNGLNRSKCQAVTLTSIMDTSSPATLARLQTLKSGTPGDGINQGVLYFYNVLLFNGARINVIFNLHPQG